MGLLTSHEDFTKGMKLVSYSTQMIDEIYRLPQGKVSIYRNHANELILTLE